MTEKYTNLLQLVPQAPKWNIDWQEIEHSKLNPFIQKMKETHQNPRWHGEDDVWTHTRMVCEALVGMEAFRALERRKQQELFLAALFHDVGKIPCTKWEDGTWVSPNHTSVGARMTREFLWMEYGFCGRKDLQEFRETICNLIRYHSVPPHILDQRSSEHRLISIAANGELTPDFSVELLCILSEADMRGRIAQKLENSLELVAICKEMAQELGCLYKPLDFPNDFSEYAYLSGKNILPGQELYDDTWGEVILLSGLPGTGKDSWIRQYCKDLPMVSLDEIRKQMKITPTDNQGAVVQAAKEQAKEYLRKKQAFVWNATDLTPLIRGKQVSLFSDYHASVRIVFLETEWEEQLMRNQNRKEEVPEAAICNMIRNLILPERFEAHKVNWYCV